MLTLPSTNGVIFRKLSHKLIAGQDNYDLILVVPIVKPPSNLTNISLDLCSMPPKMIFCCFVKRCCYL